MSVSTIDSITAGLLQSESDCKNKFVSLKTYLDRVNFVYAELIKNKLLPDVVIDSKNDTTSVKHRETGNKYFARGNYVAAIEYYTRSVAAAKTPSILALAYANRSTCLHKLGMFKTCLIDIDRAFANNYSGQKTDKLLERKKQVEKSTKSTEKYHEDVPEIEESQKNPNIQSAANCVQINTSEQFGRHIVATRTIEIGEIISVEKAFACVVRSDELLHCHECLKLCYNLLPCQNCTQALYCSEDCRNKALEAYHKYECSILLTISELKIKWILIALKVALLAKQDYDQLHSFKFDKNDYYRSDRYKEIHNLSAPVRRSFNLEFFHETVAAGLIYHLLKSQNVFENEAIEDCFKEVILLQVEIASCNGLNIYEHKPASDLVCYEGNDFAGGIFSFTSLYNHSCCRNVYRISYGSTIVIRAINTIKKGEQCFINYGSHYDYDSKLMRQLNLSKQFHFTCDCKACRGDWEAHFMHFSEALNISPFSKEAMEIQQKTSTFNVAFAKKNLPRFISMLKRHEQCEPWGKALTLKRLVTGCYDTLGNKRRV